VHIRRSFHLRLFGQSLKRIGTALKDNVGARLPDHIGATNTPAELHDSDPADTTLTTAHPELHDQLQRTTLLTLLAIELRAALNPATIAHTILVTISQYSDAGAAMIVLVGPDGAVELALSNHDGSPQPLPLEQARRVLERGPTGWDWHDSSSVVLVNDAHDLRWADAGATVPSGSVMVLPLAHGATIFGLLSISHALAGHFSSQDLLLFESVAAQAGLALSAASCGQPAQPLLDQDRQISHGADPMHTIFDHLPDGLVLLDTAGRILIANDAFCEDLLGIPPLAAIGRQYAAIIYDLEQRAQIMIEPHPSIPALRRARCADGAGRQRWYEIDRYTVDTDDGAKQVIERWRGITHPEEQQREPWHNEQLATMARLAADVVHEIGNPLQSVRSCIDLSREDATLAAPTAEYLELASSELRRMSHILSQLRDMYHVPLNEDNDE
jgi:PAS domain-containing protein